MVWHSQMRKEDFQDRRMMLEIRAVVHYMALLEMELAGCRWGGGHGEGTWAWKWGDGDCKGDKGNGRKEAGMEKGNSWRYSRRDSLMWQPTVRTMSKDDYYIDIKCQPQLGVGTQFVFLLSFLRVPIPPRHRVAQSKLYNILPRLECFFFRRHSTKLRYRRKWNRKMNHH